MRTPTAPATIIIGLQKGRIIEFDAGGIVPVIEKHFNAFSLQFLVDALRRTENCRFVQRQRAEVDLVGGNRQRPDNAFVVMTLLYDGSQQPPQSDTIAAHDDWAGLAIAVQKGRSEPLTDEGPQLEHVPHFDAPGQR